MPAPEIQQPLFPQEPALKDAFDMWKKQLMLNFFCHQVGVLKSFDPEKQTGQAQIAYKMTQFKPDAFGVLQPQLIEYPLLADCPVIFLRGSGDAGLTFPVAEGDECLILFNDRSIDNWFAGNEGGALNSQRTHHISDGIILVGIGSLAKALLDFDMERAVLYKGAARLAVGKDGKLVGIENDDFTLKEIFGDLTTQLKDLTTQLKSLTDALATMKVTGVTPGGGVSGPVGPPEGTQFATIGTAIENIGTAIESIMNDQIAELLQ